MAARVKSPGPVPREALDYFRAKDLRVGFDYRDVWGQEHAAAFTVAKVSQLDILDDIKSSIDDALANGTTFAQFKKDLIPTLQKHGWWGVKDVTDPRTGERRLAQLGSPYRLRTIYQTNLRSARAAGQWERIQRTKESHPYLLYQLGPSENHREQHVAWAGILLPVDHPWWRTHYPQNGWGCKCWVRQANKREAARLRDQGMPDPTAPLERDPKTGLPTGHRTSRRVPVRTEPPPTRTRRWVNKRTGEVVRVPVGVDPAFANNAGQDRIRILRERLTQTVASADQQFARAAVDSVMRSRVLDEWIADAKGELPAGILDRRMQRALNANSQVVRLSADTLDKQSRRHAELTAEHYRLLPGIIRSGVVIKQDAQRLAIFKRIDDRWHKVIVKVDGAGRKIYLVSYHRTAAREVRRELQRGQVVRGREQ